MRKKKPVSAADLVSKLNADPAFVAERQREEAERQGRATEWRLAEAPLVAELRTAGFGVDSVWDLVNTSVSYPAAIPILVNHLQHPYPARVREGIARALAVPEARLAWDVLTRLYREEVIKDAKDGLAVAIAGAADDSVIEEVIDLVRDVRHGASRTLLLGALERSVTPKIRTALLELEADPEIGEEVQIILRRLGRRRR